MVVRVILFLTLTINYTEVAAYHIKKLDFVVTSIMDKIFNKDDSLVFIYDDFVELELPLVMERAYAVARSTGPTRMIFDKPNSFIIHLSSQNTLTNTTEFLYNSTFFRSPYSIRGKYLVIINEINLINVNEIFDAFWLKNIQRVLVLSFDIKSDVFVKVHTSDPFDDGSDCGRKSKIVHSQLYDQNVSIKHTNIYRNIYGCNIFMTSGMDLEHPLLRCYDELMDVLATKINGFYFNNRFRNPGKYVDIPKIITSPVHVDSGNGGYKSCLEILPFGFRDPLYIIVKGGEEVPSLKLLAKVFTTKVWICVVAVYVTASIALWCIDSVKKKKFIISQLEKNFLDIFSATLWGWSSFQRKEARVCCIFICYMFYHIHIQTGFTCNLVTILTKPQYQRGISNLEELAESNTTIYGRWNDRLYFDQNDVIVDSINNRIFKKLELFLPFFYEPCVEGFKTHNRGILITELEIKYLRHQLLSNVRINIIDTGAIIKKQSLYFVLGAAYNSPSLEVCVSSITEKLFNSNETLVFLYDTLVDIELPKVMKNPYVFARLPNHVHFHLNRIPASYIIYVNNIKSLAAVLTDLYQSTLWLNRHSKTSTILIIIQGKYANNLKYIFEDFWNKNIHKLMIVTYYTTGDTNIVEVHTSDPFYEENNCGKNANVMHCEVCNHNTSVVFNEFYRNLNKCIIVLYTYSDQPHPIFWYAIHVLENLEEKVNGTFIATLSPQTLVSRPSVSLQINADAYAKYALGDITSIFLRDKFTFIVNGRNRIPELKILLIIFKNKVWILILTSFIITSIVMWLISSYAEKKFELSELGRMSIEVLSATLWGCFSSIPKRVDLRCIFICYLVYQIHIQTGFSANLSQILTTPQYERGITDLEELDEANIPIYGPSVCEMYFNGSSKNQNTTSGRLMSKLKYVDFTIEQLKDLLTNDSCAYVSIWMDVSNIMSIAPDIPFNLIDGSIIGGRTDAFFVLSRYESGLSEKDYEHWRVYFALPPTWDEATPINIRHMISAFVLLLFGLTLAIIAFVAEVVPRRACVTAAQGAAKRNPATSLNPENASATVRNGGSHC
ncbi:hypothetical protein FQR65_LT09821 [Abscondita terminalis]|nr:hypothetical protein FQR65_LT09821 [Abscondita terminalis]